jgi:hypothetical protein
MTPYFALYTLCIIFLSGIRRLVCVTILFSLSVKYLADSVVYTLGFDFYFTLLLIIDVLTLFLLLIGYKENDLLRLTIFVSLLFTLYIYLAMFIPCLPVFEAITHDRVITLELLLLGVTHGQWDRGTFGKILTFALILTYLIFSYIYR